MSEVSNQEFIDDIQDEYSVNLEENGDFIDDIQDVVSASDKKNSSGGISDADIVFGDYYIPANSRPISSGGQANVFECIKRDSGDTFIVKVYHKNLSKLEKIEEIEKRVAAIESKNVGKNLYVGHTEDNDHNLVVVMPKYAPFNGSDLIEFEKYGNNPEEYTERLIWVLSELNEGAKAFHNSKLVHFDIKPANIMQYQDAIGNRHLVYLDFGGGANIGEHSKHSFVQGNQTFSLGYMAPECARTKVLTGNAYSDMYSIGVTLAEYIVGAFPTKAYLSTANLPKLMAFYQKNAGAGEQTVGPHLLPKDLPKYIVRLLQGLLYIIPDDETDNSGRWDEDKVDNWLRYVKAHRYIDAEGIKDITNVAKAVAPVEEVKVVIPFSSGTVTVKSTEEMVDAFVDPKADRLKDVMTKLMRQKNWPENFEKFGSNVKNVLQETGNRMSKDPLQAERIFVEDIVNVYGSDRAKNFLIKAGRVFESKEALGMFICATLDEVMKSPDKKGIKSFAEIRKQSNLNSFDTLMMLFEGDSLSKFFDEKHAGWDISGENLERIKAWEKALSKNQSGSIKSGLGHLYSELYRLAFSLQNMAVIKIDDITATSGADFGNKLKQLKESRPEAALSVCRQLYADDRMETTFTPKAYAFFMEAEDVAKRPDKKMEPGQYWENRFV